MSSPLDYDVVVVGAGVEGSATAYNLAKNNHKTLLLDQFPLPHSRGSSHGHTRITRRAYTDFCYANMMNLAFEMWKQLESEENEKLYCQTGVLMIGEKHGKWVDDIAQVLQDVKAKFERLDNETLKQRFPMLQIAEKYQAIYEPDGGVLFADKCLKAFWNQIKKYHGTIRDKEEVLGITPGEPIVITTSLSQYTSRSVVLCLGPWTSKLVQPLGLQLPLEPVRANVLYWRDLTGQYRNFPCVVIRKGDGHSYSLPCYEYPKHVKICYHGGPSINPDQRDVKSAIDASRPSDLSVEEIVSVFYPGVEAQPSIQESCIYTMTPDEHFILDTHPRWKNIVIGAGFSGHGFKLSPVVGMVLAELATGRQPSFNLLPFRLSRFDKHAKL